MRTSDSDNWNERTTRTHGINTGIGSSKFEMNFATVAVVVAIAVVVWYLWKVRSRYNTKNGFLFRFGIFYKNFHNQDAQNHFCHLHAKHFTWKLEFSSRNGNFALQMSKRATTNVAVFLKRASKWYAHKRIWLILEQMAGNSCMHAGT